MIREEHRCMKLSLGGPGPEQWWMPTKDTSSPGS
jgi:hypothetical protein